MGHLIKNDYSLHVATLPFTLKIIFFKKISSFYFTRIGNLNTFLAFKFR